MKTKVTVEVPDKETCVGCGHDTGDYAPYCSLFRKAIGYASTPCAECLQARKEAVNETTN